MPYAEFTESIIDKLVPLNGKALRVQQLRCAKVRNRHVECLRCADACTSGAIAVVDGHLQVDPAKCVGCGTCATVCPTGALEARNPVDAELQNECVAASANKQTTFMCTQAAQALAGIAEEGRYVPVVCAGRVDETILAALISRGIEHINIVCGACEHCEQQHGLATAQLVAQTTNTLLQAWGAQATLAVASEPPAYTLKFGHTLKEARAALEGWFAQPRACMPVNSAEELAAMAQANATTETFAKQMHVMADGTLPHFVPDRRERLLTYLSRMGEPGERPIDTRLWGKVHIDGSKCESCLMCATFCPTGALQKFTEEDGKFGVVHYPERCVKCRSCENICHSDAITVLDEVPPRDLLAGTSYRHHMAPRPVEVGTPTAMADSYSHLAGIPIRDF